MYLSILIQYLENILRERTLKQLNKWGGYNLNENIGINNKITVTQNYTETFSQINQIIERTITDINNLSNVSQNIFNIKQIESTKEKLSDLATNNIPDFSWLNSIPEKLTNINNSIANINNSIANTISSISAPIGTTEKKKKSI